MLLTKLNAEEAYPPILPKVVLIPSVLKPDMAPPRASFAPVAKLRTPLRLPILKALPKSIPRMDAHNSLNQPVRLLTVSPRFSNGRKLILGSLNFLICPKNFAIPSVARLITESTGEKNSSTFTRPAPMIATNPATAETAPTTALATNPNALPMS